MGMRRRTGTVLLVALAWALAAGVDGAAGATAESNSPDKSLLAQLIAAAALLAVSLLLFATGRKRAVAERDIAWDGTTIHAGREIPAGEDKLKAAGLPDTDYKIQRGRFFRGLYLGKDGRWSTSKMQPLLWTYAIVFGLLALIAAKALGDSIGWDKQIDRGLQEEYLVLLGGPFAAAVLAKFITTTKDEGGEIQKTDAGPGGGGPADLISDDAGETDLVDLQYFLFNLLALGLFLGTFCFNMHEGFTNLPDLLIGLTSVSGATYVAKKAAERQRARLKAVVPSKAKVGDEVEVWGENLLIGSLMQPPPADWLPKATIGGLSATVALAPRRRNGADRTGTDRLLITVPQLGPGATDLAVYTPNGTLAGTLSLEVVT
jgi:hypothetical protein